MRSRSGETALLDSPDLPAPRPRSQYVPGRTVDADFAWRDLFSAEYPRLAGWVRRLVDDDETARDIASEAFTRLMSLWSRPDNAHAYLYRIAINLVRDNWRRTRREREALQAVGRGQRYDRAERPGDQVELRSLLQSLPRHQMAAVVLHHLAGFGVQDVAKMVGRPVGTVKSDLSQARSRLRAEMDGSDDSSI